MPNPSQNESLENVVLNVVNKTGGNAWLEGDPNWDDQEVGFSPQTDGGRIVIPAGGHATATVKWGAPADELMMGLGFSSGPGEQDWFAVSVGYPQGEKVMDVTEMYPGTSKFTIKTIKRTADTVSIELSDKEK